MWFFITFIGFIALLVLYLNHRGASGAGDNFHNADADYLPWIGAHQGDIKKRP
ncbi:hypothetical protein ACOCJ4_00800 [Knoellia sp. CPCC 206435]|uniref:hypothetical protein n=1 Tax=Knoellia terrae TaxID=3404797 RepID=UPI003B42F4AC